MVLTFASLKFHLDPFLLVIADKENQCGIVV